MGIGTSSINPGRDTSGKGGPHGASRKVQRGPPRGTHRAFGKRFLNVSFSRP